MKNSLNLGLRLACLTGAMALTTATVRAESANPDGFFFTTEVVSFEFREADTAYAIASPDNAGAIDGDFHSVGGQYETGWRLGLGYRWAGNWDFTIRYTDVGGSDNDWTDSPTGGYVAPTLTHPDEWDWSEAAEAHIDQDYQQIVAEVGRTFGDHHWVRVHAGLAYVNFDQTLTAIYYDDATDLKDEWFDVVDVRNDTNAWGVRVGAEGHLALGKESGWSLFGNAAVGVFQTNSDSKLHEAEQDGLADDPWTIVDAHESVDGTATSIEVAAGVDWMHDFDTWTFGIRFGYEMTNYSGFVSARDFVDDVHEGKSIQKNGDLGVGGPFLRFSFWF